jgi:mono/diheme cytochrome c family protein
MFRGDTFNVQRSTFNVWRLALCVLLLVASACRQKMSNQPRYDPLEPSEFFSDGMAARPRIPGTVARGELASDPVVADGFPFPVDRAVLDRGQERYDIFCQECHGRVGDGNGMIPSRGFRRPPSFHTATVRAQTTGHYFDVITNGFGSMPRYGTMIPSRDRWAIIAYIRALQLSQNATINDVPAAERAKMDIAPGLSRATTGAGAATSQGGHH